MNDKALKVLRQVELIKKYGARPDVWLYDPNNAGQKICFTQELPHLMHTEDEVQEIVDTLDLEVLVLMPDNGRRDLK